MERINKSTKYPPDGNMVDLKQFLSLIIFAIFTENILSYNTFFRISKKYKCSVRNILHFA